MAVSTVKSAISSILQDKDFDMKTPRMNLTKESAERILYAISGDDEGAKGTFASFATRLNGQLEALATPSGYKKLSTQKQPLRSGFHSARVSELRRIWTDLYTNLGVDSKFAHDPLLGEYVNEKLFEEHVKEKFEVHETCAAMVEAAELSDNDLNALRYVAGYVPWKLRQKFKKATCKHPNRIAFLACLEKMILRMMMVIRIWSTQRSGFMPLIVVDYFMLMTRYIGFFTKLKE